MAWNGVGQFVLNPAYDPEVNGTVIDAAKHNGRMNDLAAGITAALAKNGENTATANLRMGGFKHTGAGLATAAGQYVTWEQVSGLGVLVGVIPRRRVSGIATIGLSDAGYCVTHLSADTTARSWTIQANAVENYADGTAITIENQPSAGVLTLTCMDTVYLAGSGATGDRTLAATGICTLLWDATALRWIISGTGLS